jgi:hypothetical protein
MGYDYQYQQPPRRDTVGCAAVLMNFLLMAFGGILLLGVLFAFLFWRTGDRLFEGMDTMFNAPQPTPVVDVRNVVVRQIRGASELTTSIFAMEAVAPASRERTVAGITVGETKLLYIAYGEVRAGVDLSQIGAENVEVISDTIYVTLPPPQILDSKIDVNRSYIYDYDQGFLNLGPDAPELQSLAEQDALRKIIEGACAQGILEDANQRAETVVAQLLSVAGYAQVFVETQPPAPGACPAPTP